MSKKIDASIFSRALILSMQCYCDELHDLVLDDASYARECLPLIAARYRAINNIEFALRKNVSQIEIATRDYDAITDCIDDILEVDENNVEVLRAQRLLHIA